MTTTRRDFAKNALAATAAFSLPSFAMADNKSEMKKLKIVCVGGHPDDPETGCGGTLAKLAAQGNEVTIIYLTSGEAGIVGTSHAEAASIRTKEAIAACKILNAKPIFAGQIDGDSIVNNEWVTKIRRLLLPKNRILFLRIGRLIRTKITNVPAYSPYKAGCVAVKYLNYISLKCVQVHKQCVLSPPTMLI